VDSYETLLYEERDGVAIVTLNRPDVLNAFNRAMQADLRAVWRSLRRNDDVHAVVLTGAGEKAFCTGLDRGESSTWPTRARPRARAWSAARSCSMTPVTTSTRSRTTSGSR